MTPFQFRSTYSYEESESGILVPVSLTSGSLSVEMKARLDTGASDCLFDRSYAEMLGIYAEAGFRRTYQTVAGSFVAFGHEVSVRLLDAGAGLTGFASGWSIMIQTSTCPNIEVWIYQ